MTTPDILWGGIILLGVALEAVALVNRRPGGTLSETTRRAFRVRTSKTGRWTFGIAWASFSLWYLVHILYDVPFPGF